MTVSAAEDTGGHRLLAYRVEQLENAVSDIRDSVKSIDQTLKLLVVIEQQQEALRKCMESQGMTIAETQRRLADVELELPTLRLVRNWVITGMLAVNGIVGSAAVALLLR